MIRIAFVTLTCLAALAAAQHACAFTSCLTGSACVELGNNRARCVAPPKKADDAKCTKPNEVWRQCAGCEATCTNKQPMCVMMCQPARCMCGQGYFRDNKGQCVTENECDIAAQQASARARRSAANPRSQADCGPNSTFRSCSSLCPLRCGDDGVRGCIASCGPPKCECNAGFYVNKVGDCVNKFDCDVEASLSITCANIDCVSGFICRMTNGEPKCYPGKNVTCKGFDCDVGHHCKIIQQVPRCVRKTRSITCANVRCAGPCKDTPSGPECGPVTCANVRCAGPCKDTPSGPECGPRPLILPISAGPTTTPRA